VYLAHQEVCFNATAGPNEDFDGEAEARSTLSISLLCNQKKKELVDFHKHCIFGQNQISYIYPHFY
jgi:hypothetical protein